MATRNRYAEIMAQYAQSQPFSFFGYPESYTGGYDVAQPQAAAPVSRYEEIMAQQAMGGGRGISEEQRAEREAAYNAPQDYLSIDRYDPTTGTTVKDVMSAAQLAALSPAEREMHMADVRRINPYRTLLSDTFTKVGILPIVTNMYQNFRYGDIGKPLAPGAPKAPVRDVLPGEFTFANNGFVAVTPQQAAAEAAAVAQAAEAAWKPITETIRSDQSLSGGNTGGGGGGGGGVATGGRDTGGGTRDASGGGDRGTRGGFAQGGYVSMQHLGGPDPEGPDDGYAALKDGEFVINDKAVKKYGIELMNAINSGKISKGKLRGLLEM